MVSRLAIDNGQLQTALYGTGLAPSKERLAFDPKSGYNHRINSIFFGEEPPHAVFADLSASNGPWSSQRSLLKPCNHELKKNRSRDLALFTGVTRPTFASLLI